jgi:glucuronate isomerase
VVMTFVSNSFLLHSETAARLFHEYAWSRPIFDNHSHLSPRDIAEDRRFGNLFEIWLAEDYKWRPMRADGVAERYCTVMLLLWESLWHGTGPFRTPCATRFTTGHTSNWSRDFGIHELQGERTAPQMWARANGALPSGERTVKNILKKFGFPGLVFD